ncbi:MAG TPA: hypothetical protein PLB21_08240 [Actinomycetota bacterium]|nr:hypothetical protein [Actinomycetota bacterium]
MADEVEYEDLPYEELRDRAFKVAEHRHDLNFFYDLYAHTPAMHAMEGEGGSLGEIGGSIIEIVRGAREAFGERSVGDMKPLFVAVFATYLRDHPEEPQQ